MSATSQVLPGESAAMPVAWTGAERESFFEAIARHRRAAWRVTLASSVAEVVVALVVAVLTAPLFYAALALAFDVANLVRPVPNLIASIGAAIDPVFDAPETVALTRWLYLGFLAALPGFAWMTWVLVVLKRAVRMSGVFSGGELTARAPSAQVLAEQRFADVVGEMAVAASLPAPRVLIADSGASNAAVFGSDEQHATIIASRALLAALTREQMQGVAAMLVGSIANGDMGIGMRVATTLGLFGLIARLAAGGW